MAVDRFTNPDPEGEQRLPELRARRHQTDTICFCSRSTAAEEPPLPRFQRETTAGAWPIGRPDVSR